MTTSTSTTSTFILLFYMLFLCVHASCPTKCANGYNKADCECDSNCYRKLRQGVLTCQYCSKKCPEDENQMEVTPCTEKSNRVCSCKPGFYCEKGNNYSTYCHKPCVPCKTGTFSSEPTLNSCKPHKDCAQLGMLTFKEGTSTEDRECVSSIIITTTPRTDGASTQDRESVNATTKMAASTASIIITTISSDTTPTPRTDGASTQDRESVNATTKMAASSASNLINTISSDTVPSPRTVKKIVALRSLGTDGASTQDRESVNATTKMAASTASIIITTIFSKTTPTPSTGTEGNQHKHVKPEENQSSWLLLLILLLMLLFMTGFCMLMKGKALKTLSKCFGLINGDYEKQQHWRQKVLSNSQSITSTDHNRETEIPIGSDVNGPSMGMAPQSGGVQQVTVKHDGKGENVSNTVGSIYIYSPRMVVLGSNSGDKKEESGVSDEALPLISAPQQESNPPSQEVRITMSAQEKAEEEPSLSFPVPATGK